MLRSFILTAFIIGLISIVVTCQFSNGEFNNAFEFITAADMRYYVSNQDKNTHHFEGALEAIKKVGPGNFLVSTGDIDPPAAVRAAIDSIDKNQKGIVLIIDEDLRLVSTITDGDIRRAMLVGQNLDSNVKELLEIKGESPFNVIIQSCNTTPGTVIFSGSFLLGISSLLKFFVF